MEDFLYVGSWFDKMFREKSSSRYPTFKAALNLYHQRIGKVIVETGTTRMVNDYGAGYSTFIFGNYLSHYGGHLWTVDIDPNNIEVCKVVTQPFAKNITYMVGDSLEFFLEKETPVIDLLYLDSVDFPLDGSDPTPCQEHQLKEFKLAERKLGAESIILLDDNDFPGGGKTKLTKEYLIDNGWHCILDSQQSLWFV